MPVILQYRPSSFTGCKGEARDYNTLQELLTIDWVNHYSKLPGFYRFSVSTYNKIIKYWLLMAEYKDGFDWYVVGYIQSPIIAAQLPFFEPKYKEQKKYGCL